MSRKTSQSHLTPKERAFVVAYAGKAAGNATKAAVIAGYASKSAHVTGSRLLKKANIKAALRSVTDRHESSDIADADERRQMLTRLARRDKSPIVKIKALDVLNRMDGLYVQKHQHTGADGGPITFTDILARAREPRQ